MAEKLMLIDGHSILNRAFYGIPDLTNSEGIHTNAMYGFLNIMFKFLDEENPDYITVAFDVSAPTFRHEKYAGYKGTRKPMASELKQQVPLIKEILTAMNIKIIEMAGYEADDILGTIAKKSAAQGINVSVISGDRDLLQLAEENIKIRIPKTKKGITEVEDYLPADVEALYGVTPIEFIDMKALMGDTSDNIPGAPGVGPKTAGAIIQKYHSIDNVIAHLDEVTPPKARQSISDNIEQVKLSRFLAEINVNVPVEYDINSAKMGGFFNNESYELFKKYNFKSHLKRFDLDTIKNESALNEKVFENFKLIEDLSDAENVFEEAKNVIQRGLDIGFTAMCYEGGNYGVSLALPEEHIYYIPMAGFMGSDYLNDKISELAKAAGRSGENRKNIVNEMDSNKASHSEKYGKDSTGHLITANLKELLDIFKEPDGNRLRVDEQSFVDVSLGAYLLNPNSESYEYDNLANDFLGITVNSKTEILGKSTYKEAAFINVDGMCKVGCLTSYICLESWKKVLEKLENQSMKDLFFDIEMPLLFVLYSMEKEGVRVDKESLARYGTMLGERINVIEQEIYSEAGEEFNINSTKQLGVILFEKMNMPYGKKTKSGYSTAADVLGKLAPDYPFVKKILEYRQLVKLKSTYADGLSVYIKEDGRIHGKFNQTITATGRISSTEPNLQNIPVRMELGREIRKVFIPKEGCVFLDADYSQIELRILAHMSGDKKLIEAYNSAQDIHRITASQVFKVPFDHVTDLQRRNAKAVNFGIIYGISSFGLSQDLSISRKEANDYINQYFETYPDIKKFIDGMVESAKETGYSLTMYNRRRPIPELKSSNYMQRSFGERVAMNAPIQGTAADIIKLAMIRVYNELKNRNLKSRLILQIHDELLVETYIDEIDEVQDIITEGMKGAAKLLVPLEIDLKQGGSWFEAH